jgi:hypothetical protein
MTLGKQTRGLKKRAATGAPLTDVELREFGDALRPFARELSTLFRQFLADEFEDIGHVFALQVHSPADMKDFVKISVRVPAFTVAWATAILATIPGVRRGRPRKPSTIEALMLLEKVKSSHGAAKRVAVSAGEPPEHIRSRLRGIKQRAKKHRLDTKRRPKGGGKK